MPATRCTTLLPPLRLTFPSDCCWPVTIAFNHVLQPLGLAGICKFGTPVRSWEDLVASRRMPRQTSSSVMPQKALHANAGSSVRGSGALSHAVGATMRVDKGGTSPSGSESMGRGLTIKASSASMPSQPSAGNLLTSHRQLPIDSSQPVGHDGNNAVPDDAAVHDDDEAAAAALPRRHRLNSIVAASTRQLMGMLTLSTCADSPTFSDSGSEPLEDDDGGHCSDVGGDQATSAQALVFNPGSHNGNAHVNAPTTSATAPAAAIVGSGSGSGSGSMAAHSRATRSHSDSEASDMDLGAELDEADMVSGQLSAAVATSTQLEHAREQQQTDATEHAVAAISTPKGDGHVRAAEATLRPTALAITGLLRGRSHNLAPLPIAPQPVLEDLPPSPDGSHVRFIDSSAMPAGAAKPLDLQNRFDPLLRASNSAANVHNPHQRRPSSTASQAEAGAAGAAGAAAPGDGEDNGAGGGAGPTMMAQTRNMKSDGALMKGRLVSALRTGSNTTSGKNSHHRRRRVTMAGDMFPNVKGVSGDAPRPNIVTTIEQPATPMTAALQAYGRAGFEAALQTANGLPWLAKALAFEQPKGEADYTSVVYDVLLKKRAPWTASKVRGRFSVVKYLDAGDFVLPCTWLLLAAGW